MLFNQYDNIFHEHIGFHSLKSIIDLSSRNNYDMIENVFLENVDLEGYKLYNIDDNLYDICSKINIFMSNNEDKCKKEKLYERDYQIVYKGDEIDILINSIKDTRLKTLSTSSLLETSRLNGIKFKSSNLSINLNTCSIFSSLFSNCLSMKSF